MKINRYNQFIVEKTQSKRLEESLVNEELGYKDGLIALATLLSTFSGGKVDAQTTQLAKKASTITQMSLSQVQNALEKEGEKTGDKKFIKAAEQINQDTLNKIKSISKGELTNKVNVQATSLESLRNHLLSGFTLTNAEKEVIKDTIIKSPEMVLVYDTIAININENQLFDEGSFVVSQETKQNLVNELKKIKESKSKLASVTVISSTDKQSLTVNLQELLKSMKLEPSNVGLSKARNNAVSSIITYLTDNISKLDSGSEPTILRGKDGKLSINKIEFAEQGKGEISVEVQDPEARYVKVEFVVLRSKPNPEASKTMEINDIIKYKFNLSKEQHGTSGIDKTGITTSGKSGSGIRVSGNQAISCPIFN